MADSGQIEPSGSVTSMTFAEKLRDAWACETCRRYRQGVLLVLAALALTWLLS